MKQNRKNRKPKNSRPGTNAFATEKNGWENRWPYRDWRRMKAMELEVRRVA